jgi:hypothetical protein
MPENISLLVVVADLDAEEMMNSLLLRNKALGIGSLGNAKVKRYASRDSGCYGQVEDFVEPSKAYVERLVVMFDRHGSGAEHLEAEAIENEVLERLNAREWQGRAEVVVFEPELEILIWSSSNHVASILGWDSTEQLKNWLRNPERVARDSHVIGKGERLWYDNEQKPRDPKDAYRQGIRQKGVPYSASHFSELAKKVSLRGCEDRAFKKLVQVLKTWFPVQ